MPRLFFAIETPPPLKKELVVLQDTLADRLRQLDPTPNFKPERLINSHCTLRFLGNVDESNVPLLSNSVSREIISAKIHSFNGTLTDCGVFPNSRHARVFWVGLTPEEPFQKIQHAIDEELRAANIPFEAEYSFHPHLTLFRFRESYRIPKDFEFPNLISPAATISEVLLIESKTLPDGPRHTVRERIPLG